MKKQTNLLNIIIKAIGIINFILFLILGINLLKLNILPSNYLYLIIGILTIINITLLIGSLLAKKRIASIVVGIITLISSIAMILAVTYSSNFQNFIKDIVDNKKSVEYYFLVNKEDSSDLKDYLNTKIGILETDVENTKEVLKQINFNNYQNINTSIFDLLNNLSDKEIRAIVINTNGLEIIKDIVDDFESYKVIRTETIIIDDSSDKIETNITKNGFIVYISGIDTYGEIGKVSRSDVNILAVFNPKTAKILLVHIPRDSYMKFAGINSNLKDKLTHSGVYGIKTSIGTLENFFDTKINYYIRINFTTLVNAVDILGGISVYNEDGFKTIKGTYFNKGNIELTGAKALEYSRERKNLVAGDISRGEHQQDVIEGLIKKSSNPNILLKYNDLLDSLKNTFETNMSSKEMSEFVKLQLSSMLNWEVESYSLTGVGQMKKTYTYPNRDLYVMELSTDKVNIAKEKINSYLTAN